MRAALRERMESVASGKWVSRAARKVAVGMVRVMVPKPAGVMTSMSPPGWYQPRMPGPCVILKWKDFAGFGQSWE